MVTYQNGKKVCRSISELLEMGNFSSGWLMMMEKNIELAMKMKK